MSGRVSLSTIEGAEVYADGALKGITPLAGPIEDFYEWAGDPIELGAAQLDGVIAERAGKASQGGLAEFLYQRLERQQRLINEGREHTPAKVNR